MVGLHLTFGFLVILQIGWCMKNVTIEEQETKDCDVIVKESCSLSFQTNETFLNLKKNSFSCHDGTGNRSLNLRSANTTISDGKEFIRICANDLHFVVSKTVSENNNNRNFSSCASPLINILLPVKSDLHRFRRSANGRGGKSRDEPHHNHMNSLLSRIKHTGSQRKHLKKLLVEMLSKCDPPRKYVKSNTHVSTTTLMRMVRQKCASSSRSAVSDSNENRTAKEKIQRKRRSITSTIGRMGAPSVEICKVAKNLTLNVISQNNSDVDVRHEIQRAQNTIILLKSSPKLTMTFKWDDSGNTERNVLRIDIQLVQNSSNQALPGTNSKLNPNSIVNKPEESTSETNNNSLFIILPVVAVVFIAVGLVLCMWKPYCSGKEGANRRECDTYSEESVSNNDHEMSLLENQPRMTSSAKKGDCDSTYTSSFHNNNRQITHTKQCVLYNSNSRPSHVCLCQGKRYNPAISTNQRCRPQRTSPKSAPNPRELFHRVPNNPHRREASQLTPELLNRANYPPSVLKWPASSRSDLTSRFPTETSRFQTPPNRVIVGNNGSSVASLSRRDDYSFHSEPTTLTSGNLSEPPKYSPLNGSAGHYNGQTLSDDAITLLSSRRTYFSTRPGDAPPEYSQPPGYYSDA